jgi:photosystem II stability/assembly factor-like uncharacterized protein
MKRQTSGVLLLSLIVSVLAVAGLAEESTGKRDFREEAFRWRQMSRTDESGRVPTGALQRALRDRQVNLDASLQSSTNALSRASWTNRGPQNVGGRTRALLIDPQNSNILWAGAAGGGVWKSTDGGTSWLPVDDFMANLAVSSLAMNPLNSNELYCGTGEGFFNGDALDGAGIFKSTDGGTTWPQLAATASWTSVNRIAIAPTNGSLILAATRGPGGIQRSTDAGASWTTVRSAQWALDVSFDPNDSMKAVAEVADYDFTVNDFFHSALYSTDGGATWSTSTGGLSQVYNYLSRIELAYAPGNPQIVYASVGVNGGEIWRSTDGGQSYTQITTSSTSGANWYANPLWVSPTDVNLIVTGGFAVFKSTDGGANLTQISDGYLLTQQPHPDIHLVLADPGYNGTTNKRVYVTTDGGIFRTDDITTATTGPSGGWFSLNATYQTTQYYSGAGNGESGLVIGGTQDNGTLRSPSGDLNATLMYGGDGGFSAIDPTDDTYCYAEYQTFQIIRSTDHCLTASALIAPPETNGANFVAPFILDPNDSNRMLAGGASLWVSNDVRTAATWTAIRAPGSDKLSAIAVAPGNSDIIWVAQNDGKVYKTSNGLSATPTWSVVDDNGGTDPLPNRMPMRILIDPDNAKKVYIAFGGFSDGNLQRTTDGGTRWADVTGSGPTGLPLAPIRGIARHPTNANELFVGTEVGVFETTDGGANWSTMNEGPASVSVDELVLLPGTGVLLAATHGRGLWTTDVAPGPGLTKDGFKCESTTGTALSKFAVAKTRCVQKCFATQRKTKGPYSDCVAPFGGATLTCITDPATGAEAKAGAAIGKACTARPDSCPKCFTPTTKCTDATTANPFVTSAESNLDLVGPQRYCLETGTGGPVTTPDDAQAKCEDGLTKALTKFGSAKSKCYSTCDSLVFKGAISPLECNPPATDPATVTCVNTATGKATAAIGKVCFGAAPIETPPCYDGTVRRPNSAAGWVSLVETAVDSTIPTVACGSPSGAFLD